MHNRVGVAGAFAVKQTAEVVGMDVGEQDMADRFGRKPSIAQSLACQAVFRPFFVAGTRVDQDETVRTVQGKAIDDHGQFVPAPLIDGGKTGGVAARMHQILR